MPPNQSACRRSHSTETALTVVFKTSSRSSIRAIWFFQCSTCQLFLIVWIMIFFWTVRICLICLMASDRSFTSGWRSTSAAELGVSNTMVWRHCVEIMWFWVPHGSVLGPQPFLLYTADIHHITMKHSVRSLLRMIHSFTFRVVQMKHSNGSLFREPHAV